MFGRQKVAMVVAEFVSATVLSMIMLSLVARTNFPFFAAVAAGLSLGTMAYTFGTHTNPVITLGMWTLRKVQTAEAVVTIVAQMLGGVAAWQLSQYLINSDLKSMAPANFDWHVLLAEALGAFVLGLGVAVAVQKAYDGARWAVTVGASLALGVLVASLASNGLLNPSVAAGVQSWDWAYVLGPILGSVIGMNFYSLLYVEGAFSLPLVGTKAAKVAAPKRTTTKVVAKKKPATRKRK